MATPRTVLLVSSFALLVPGCGQPNAETNNAGANEITAAGNSVVQNNTDAGNLAATAAAEPAANALAGDTSTTNWTLPAAEPHYASREGDKYYYVSAVSEEDKKKGIAVGDVVITRNLGRVDGKQTLAWIKEDGTVESVSTCSHPCKIIKEVDANGGNLRLIPYNEESIIGMAFADSFNGFMKKSKRAAPAMVDADGNTAQQ